MCGSPPEPGSREPTSDQPTVSARGGARGPQRSSGPRALRRRRDRTGVGGQKVAGGNACTGKGRGLGTRSHGGGGSGSWGGTRARGGAAGWGRCGAAPSGRPRYNLQTDLGSHGRRAPPPLPPRRPGAPVMPQSGQRRRGPRALGTARLYGDSTVPLGPTGTCTRVSPEASRPAVAMRFPAVSARPPLPSLSSSPLSPPLPCAQPGNLALGL